MVSSGLLWTSPPHPPSAKDHLPALQQGCVLKSVYKRAVKYSQIYLQKPLRKSPCWSITMPLNKFNQLVFPPVWEQTALSSVEPRMSLACKEAILFKTDKSLRPNLPRLTEGEVDGNWHWWKNCISTSCAGLVGLQKDSVSLLTLLFIFSLSLLSFLPSSLLFSLPPFICSNCW